MEWPLAIIARRRPMPQTTLTFSRVGSSPHPFGHVVWEAKVTHSERRQQRLRLSEDDEVEHIYYMCVVKPADARIADSPNNDLQSRSVRARSRIQRNPLQETSCTNAAILSAPRRKTCALYTYPP